MKEVGGRGKGAPVVLSMCDFIVDFGQHVEVIFPGGAAHAEADCKPCCVD